ncbi:unnamed protein product [Trichobilharzia szidati]|nr:unnamed protein product [Trichobilharzia szidati]
MSIPGIGEITSDTSFLTKVVDEYVVGSSWTQEYSKNDVKIWSKCSDNNGIKAFKASALFKGVSGPALFDCLMDSQYRKQWDKAMIEGYELCQVNSQSDIGYYSLRSPPGLRNRDFVLQRTWAKFENEYVIASHSVFHKGLPVRKQFIRALSHINAYIIRILSPDSCEMTYVTHCDPRGKIPIWVINKATQFMAPKAIQLLYKACSKYDAWKQSNNPDQKPWLYSNQSILPNLCWDDVEQTANLGPVDDDASASSGGDASGQLTPLDDERSVFERNDSFNDSEEFQPMPVMVVDDDNHQMQSCVVPQSQTTTTTAAAALTTVSDSG